MSNSSGRYKLPFIPQGQLVLFWVFRHFCLVGCIMLLIDIDKGPE